MPNAPRLTDKSLKVLRLFLEKPREPLSGAEIGRATSVGSGTLYPLLARFETAGWLSSEWETADPCEIGRPRQRFYRLTALGQSQAIQALSDLRVPEGMLEWSR